MCVILRCIMSRDMIVSWNMTKRKLPYSEIAELYKSNTITVQEIAMRYMTTARTVQRIAIAMGVNISMAEANTRTAKLKAYYKKPEHLKVKRKHINHKLRYEMIMRHPFCANCGAKSKDGIRLEVDHIDEDCKNNDRNNLQVLCNLCNKGKYEFLNEMRLD